MIKRKRIVWIRRIVAFLLIFLILGFNFRYFHGALSYFILRDNMKYSTENAQCVGWTEHLVSNYNSNLNEIIYNNDFVVNFFYEHNVIAKFVLLFTIMLTFASVALFVAIFQIILEESCRRHP